MINFNLRELDKILPVGQEPNLSLNWFWLTDADLWLKFGDHTIYEYSKEAINYWGNKPTPYCDYPLVRFIEDFTEIFDKIREPVPDEIYSLTSDLIKIQIAAKKMLEVNNIVESESNDFILEQYEKLNSWINQRSIDSSHLIGGPYLSFFRNNNKIRIIWDTDFLLENGISLWTANNDSFEMDYFDFVNKIKMFAKEFFVQMDNQINLAIARDWGTIKIDKLRLIEEHKERKENFFSKISLLEINSTNETNWQEIEHLFKQIS